MKSSLTPYWESFKDSETLVSDDPSSYRGLHPEALCTDPEDILTIISDPLIQGAWVDLGSGYGHTVLTYAEKFPDRVSIGVEKELSRVELARKISGELGLSSKFIMGDLLSSDIPEGNVYFLYFPQGHVLDRILSVLMQRKDIILVAIESHGDLFPRLEKEKWLTFLKTIPLKSPRHNAYARIYRSEKVETKLAGLHEFSFRNIFFLISQNGESWLGESFGLYASGENYILMHPPRSVEERDVVKIMTIDQLNPREKFLSDLRRLGDIQIVTRDRIFSGVLRKIIITPAFSVELSSGERVEWSQIQSIKQGLHLCYDSSSSSFLGGFSLPLAR
jgi:hypothetical protein